MYSYACVEEVLEGQVQQGPSNGECGGGRGSIVFSPALGMFQWLNYVDRNYPRKIRRLQEFDVAFVVCSQIYALIIYLDALIFLKKFMILQDRLSTINRSSRGHTE
jgi:hypothetical protein